MQSTLSFGQKPLAANPPAKKRPLNEAHAAQTTKAARPPSAKAPAAKAPAAPATVTSAPTVAPAAPAAAVWAALRQQQALGVSTSSGGSAYRSLADRRQEEAEILARTARAPAVGGGGGGGRGQDQGVIGHGSVNSGTASGGTTAHGQSGGGGKGGWRKLPGGESAYVTASGKRLSGKVAFAAAAREKKR